MLDEIMYIVNEVIEYVENVLYVVFEDVLKYVYVE